MKKETKETIYEHLIMLVILFVLIFTGIYYYSKEKKVEAIQKDNQIDSLKSVITELKKVDKSTIIITDTVLVVWSNFDIKHNAYQHPNTRKLHDGINEHDFTINDSTRVEMIIIKN